MFLTVFYVNWIVKFKSRSLSKTIKWIYLTSYLNFKVSNYSNA